MMLAAAAAIVQAPAMAIIELPLVEDVAVELLEELELVELVEFLFKMFGRMRPRAIPAATAAAIITVHANNKPTPFAAAPAAEAAAEPADFAAEPLA